MRDLGAGTTSHLATTSGIIAKRLVSIAAKNTATNQIENIRFWTGDTNTNFTIGGVGMIFEGAQGIIRSEPIEYSIGMNARRYRITISGITSDIETLLRDRDLQSAPMAVYGVVLNPVDPVDNPFRDIKGVVEGATFETGKLGASNKIIITVVTSAMYLAQGLDIKWSDATQRRDAPGVTLASNVTYTTSQTVLLGPNSTLDLTLNAGQPGTTGSDGIGENGVVASGGGMGGPTSVVVKDSGGTVIYSYSVPGGGNTLFATGLTGANNGSVVMTVGAGGSAGTGIGATAGAGGSVQVATASATPVPDGFFRYADVAGEIKSQWA
jgi:hypothetical protein